MWTFLSILAFIAMIVFFRRGQNAVWGGATIGLLIGIIVGLFSKHFFPAAYKPIVIGVLLGAIFEILPNLFKRSK